MPKTEFHVIPPVHKAEASPDDHYVIKIDGEEFIKHPGGYAEGIATYNETLQKEPYTTCELLIWKPLYEMYIRHAYSLKGDE